MKKASEKPKEKWLKNKNKKDLKQKENIWKNNTRLEKQQLLLNEQMLKENCLNLERRKDKSKKELVFFKNNKNSLSNKNVLAYFKNSKNNSNNKN